MVVIVRVSGMIARGQCNTVSDPVAGERILDCDCQTTPAAASRGDRTRGIRGIRFIVIPLACQLSGLHLVAQALHAQLALGASSPPPEQPRPACHHAYVLREMRWLANDFGQVGL